MPYTKMEPSIFQDSRSKPTSSLLNTSSTLYRSIPQPPHRTPLSISLIKPHPPTTIRSAVSTMSTMSTTRASAIPTRCSRGTTVRIARPSQTPNAPIHLQFRNRPSIHKPPLVRPPRPGSVRVEPLTPWAWFLACMVGRELEVRVEEEEVAWAGPCDLLGGGGDGTPQLP